jgi:hypothetical protein
MAFTPSAIGSANGNNVASLSIVVPNALGISAGHQLWVAYGGSSLLGGNGVPTDPAGNVYSAVAAESTGTANIIVFQVPSSLALSVNAGILLVPPTAVFSGRAAAFSATGFLSGIVEASSSGIGTSTLPDVALNNVPANNWCIGVVGVAGPSSDGFTQPTGWSNLGNLNTQTTTNFSIYAGYLQSTGGQVVYAPTLGVSRDWVGLLLSLQS